MVEDEKRKWIPPEQWIPERPFDYTDWMDAKGRYFSDLTPEEKVTFLASLTPEDRKMYEE